MWWCRMTSGRLISLPTRVGGRPSEAINYQHDQHRNRQSPAYLNIWDRNVPVTSGLPAPIVRNLESVSMLSRVRNLESVSMLSRVRNLESVSMLLAVRNLESVSMLLRVKNLESVSMLSGVSAHWRLLCPALIPLTKDKCGRFAVGK